MGSQIKSISLNLNECVLILWAIMGLNDINECVLILWAVMGFDYINECVLILRAVMDQNNINECVLIFWAVMGLDYSSISLNLFDLACRFRKYIETYKLVFPISSMACIWWISLRRKIITSRSEIYFFPSECTHDKKLQPKWKENR